LVTFESLSDEVSKWVRLTCNNNNNNNNNQDYVYGAVIMADPLRKFIRFI